jgi:hypothetical protein
MSSPTQNKQRHDITLLILGDSPPQKAVLIRRFLGQEISHREAIWEDYAGKTQFQSRLLHLDCQNLTVRVRNISDFEFFMQSGLAFFHRIDGCILTYNSHTPGSFDTAKAWRKEFRLSARLRRNDAFPFLFLDCDGIGAGGGRFGADIAKFKQEHAHCRNIFFGVACAATGERVDDAFDQIIRSAIKRAGNWNTHGCA